MKLTKNRKKQLEKVFFWLSSVISQDELILVDADGKRADYSFCFPLKIGDKPRTINVTKRIDDCKFYIKFGNEELEEYLIEDWLSIFKMPDLEISVSKNKLNDEKNRKFFSKLSTEEKITAIKCARESAASFLSKKCNPGLIDIQYDNLLPDVFHSNIDVGVAIWLDGKMRGYAIAERMMFDQGIIKAAVGACSDSRFKPISLNELPQARFEITLISDLKIPCSEELLRNNQIVYNKGFSIERNNEKILLLPLVFNSTKFDKLKEFPLRSDGEWVGLKNLGFPDKKIEFNIFEVQDFIESEKKDEIFDLDGPVLVQKKFLEIEDSARLAADWLLRIQEPDGNFPPIINPIGGPISQVDWSRCAFSAWSLAEFGKAVNNQSYFEASLKTYFFLKDLILKNCVSLEPNRLALTLAYFGQLCLVLGYPLDALESGFEIAKKREQLKFEPILYCQLSSFFLALFYIRQNFFAPAINFAQICRSFFDNNLKKNKEMNSPAWAELGNVYIQFFSLTGESYYYNEAKKIIDWMLLLGPRMEKFKSIDNKSYFSYTRGIGKIIEVLASFINSGQFDDKYGVDYYKEYARKAFFWMQKMQYTNEGSYFVPGRSFRYVIGGFRHDYINNDLWIDSAAHFLLAASRFISLNDKNGRKKL